MENRFRKEYKDKLRTLEEAAKFIESGDHIAVPPVQGEPEHLCRAIADRLRTKDLKNITLTNVWTLGNGNPLFDPSLKDQVEIDSTFICDAYRWSVNTSSSHFIPANYMDVPRLFSRGMRRVDVFMAEVAPMDRHGYFNLSLALSHSQTIIRTAKKVILVVNEEMPRVYGDTAVHISQVDLVVEDTHDLIELVAEGTSPNAMKMAGYIAEMVPDGACLQVGVGNVPNAVTSLLKGKKDLGIHTELFCECMIDLIECGAVNNSQKSIDRGKSVFTFAMGTKRMYDYVDENPGVAAFEVDYVNDPMVIARNKKVISINATLQVDLTGQCCSESLGWRQYSGVGGQADFCRGAYFSEGGKSFLCMNSTAKNGAISTIVPMLSSGAIVSTKRTECMYIVTEYGIATMIGKSVRERVKELIEIAHPDFRSDLKREANKMGLL